MNRVLLLGCLSIALSAMGCGEPLPAPPASDSTRTVLQTVTQNANWSFDSGSFGTVNGDHVTVTLFGNGQGVPTGMEFQLRDSSNFAIAGSFRTTSYQPGGTWNTGIRGFNVSGGPGLLVGAPTSSIPSATITQVGANSWSVDFSGTSYYRIYAGDGQDYIQKDFDFSLGADIPGDVDAEQVPIPDDGIDSKEEPENCPVWSFEETALGVSAIQPGTPSARPNVEIHAGDEVRTGWNGTQFVIKMESNLQRPEEYILTVVLDQYPAEGLNASYDVQVFSFSDDKRNWAIFTPGAATLDIVDWKDGSFFGTLNFNNFELLDEDQIGTAQYWEKNIVGSLEVHAPLPMYNQAYDDLCTELEEDTGWSILATLQAALNLADCVATLTATRSYCRATFDDNSTDEEVLLNGLLCFYYAAQSYKKCVQNLVP